jgi:hypothetical protein
MSKFVNMLQQLRTEREQAQAAVEKLSKAILAIESLNGAIAGNPTNRTRPKRFISAAARKRIAAAQRARWAKFKNRSLAANAKAAKSGPPRISAEGRKRIAAAARARWARVRSQQSKKAA